MILKKDIEVILSNPDALQNAADGLYIDAIDNDETLTELFDELDNA